VLPPPAPVAPQLRGFIGVRVKIAQTAFHRPRRASRAVFGYALAPLFSGFQWLKL